MGRRIVIGVYAVILVMLLGGFSYAGMRGYRVLSAFNSSNHWHHGYHPGVHMLRHK